MIRVKLLDEKEYRALKNIGGRNYDPSDFFELLRQKGDFTDPESCALLCTLHGEEAVRGKWYRRTTPEGKPCLPAVSPEAQYGLVVIERSRQGLYTDIPREFQPFETMGRMERAVGSTPDVLYVWDALAELEMDILLYFRKRDFDFSWEIPLSCEFLLENGAPQGPVWVKKNRARKKHGTETYKGFPCVDDFFYDLQYHWYENVEEMVDAIREENSGQKPLPRGEMSRAMFGKLCDEDAHDWWDEPAKDDEAPRRLINYMEALPVEPEERRPLFLVVQAFRDGSFHLWNQTPVKYPSYNELLDWATTLAWEGAEVPGLIEEAMVLVVDVNEILACASQISRTVCAFRFTAQVTETYGKRQGLEEFSALLRRAQEAGTIVLPEKK